MELFDQDPRQLTKENLEATMGKDYLSWCESTYNQLLLSALSEMCYEAVAEIVYDNMIAYLQGSDFYTAPASTRFHDSHIGGLVLHSLRVVGFSLDLLETSAFQDIEPSQAVLAALTHDWCKIGLYEPYTRNVKNEVTGAWEQVAAYRWKENRAPTYGHGATSAMIIQKLFAQVPESVLLAVRWHMGAWDVSASDEAELGRHNRENRLGLLLQFADQLSTARF